MGSSEELRINHCEVVGEGGSVPPFQYYPVCRMKKRPIQARLMMACCLGGAHCLLVSRAWRIQIGMGWTLVEGGSSLL